MAYLEKLDPAVSGAGGHNATFKAALACRRFGLSEAEAYAALQAYNARCTPPWSEKELRHKIASVFAVPIQRPLGQGRRGGTRSVVFVAPNWPKSRPPVPVMYQSEAEEEAWWAAVFAERGINDPA